MCICIYVYALRQKNDTEKKNMYKAKQVYQKFDKIGRQICTVYCPYCTNSCVRIEVLRIDIGFTCVN
jgi:hypothetical protein